MRCSLKTLFILLSVLVLIIPGQTKAQAPETQARPVDVVLTLDLSGSTNGLVDNIRDKMWDIINQWKMFQPRPKLRIGIVGFSRLSFTGGSGYVKILCDLTDDYDIVSNSLFSLPRSVENGYQFIGMALDASVNSMDWSENASSVKIIYLIGNGKVNLGTVDFRKVCETAKEKNIVINTVYCNKTIRNNRSSDISGWAEIATITGGSQYDTYVNRRAPLLSVKVDLPTLVTLTDSFNSTYLPYGKSGGERLKLMKSADENAGSVYGSYLYSRLKYKLSEEYKMKQFLWDIVTYKEIYPETKLSALKVSANKDSNATGGLDLEEYVDKNLEARTKLSEIIRGYFPSEEEKRVQSEIAYADYDLSNMLDRIFIVSFYQMATKNGLKPNPD